MQSLLKVFFILVLVSALTQVAFGEVTVEITEPTEGSNVTPCSDLTIKMNVTATAGEEVQYVYLLYNGRTLRRLRSEPWEHEWKTMKKGVYSLQARVELADGTEIYSDPVKFKVGTVHGGEVLYSGGFDCGVLAPWTGQLNEGAVGQFWIFDDGYFDDPTYLFVEIENGGTAEWHIQLNQTCPTDSGHLYTISFLADSDEPKTIYVGMQENQDPWANQIWQAVDIDGADLYSLDFESTRTDPTNVLRFNVGGNTIPFYLDDVSVIDNSATSVKSKQLDFVDGPVSEFELFQAYPNPFNMNTTIRYVLSNPAHVTLDIYNMTGQKVRSLTNNDMSAGMHSAQWNGIDDFGSIVTSGVYIYRLQVNHDERATVLSRKVLLMK